MTVINSQLVSLQGKVDTARDDADRAKTNAQAVQERLEPLDSFIEKLDAKRDSLMPIVEMEGIPAIQEVLGLAKSVNELRSTRCLLWAFVKKDGEVVKSSSKLRVEDLGKGQYTVYTNLGSADCSYQITCESGFGTVGNISPDGSGNQVIKLQTYSVSGTQFASEPRRFYLAVFGTRK